MDIWLLVMEIGALVGTAFLFGAIAQRLNQSAIVGYLLAGAILARCSLKRSRCRT